MKSRIEVSTDAHPTYDWVLQKLGDTERLWGSPSHWAAFDGAGRNERFYVAAIEVLERISSENRNLNPKAVMASLLDVLSEVASHYADDIAHDVENEATLIKQRAIQDYSGLDELIRWASRRSRETSDDFDQSHVYHLFGDVCVVVQACVMHGSYEGTIKVYREGRKRTRRYKRDGVAVNFNESDMCHWCFRTGFRVHGGRFACADHRRLSTAKNDDKTKSKRRKADRDRPYATDIRGRPGLRGIRHFFVVENAEGHTAPFPLLHLASTITSGRHKLEALKKIVTVELAAYPATRYSLRWLISNMPHVNARLVKQGISPDDTLAVITTMDPIDPEDIGVQQLLHQLYIAEPRLFRDALIWAEAWLAAAARPRSRRRSAP